MLLLSTLLNNRGRTPLMYAASAGNRQIISSLLGRGASISLQDSEGKTAAMLALEHGFNGADLGLVEATSTVVVDSSIVVQEVVLSTVVEPSTVVAEEVNE